MTEAAAPAVTEKAVPAARGNAIAPGNTLGDFELLQILGEGAFGQVFLARQTSLDRLVAVKVSENRGSEARTLASLEHDHIVHVFLEMVDAERDLRLLCMQYVPGTTLERIIEVMKERGGWDGRALLDAIDARTLHPPRMDPAALRDREFLGQCDSIEAVCWLGSRLAEALAYAHKAGVLHRDVKPANVLVSPFGRPMLADFNIAVDMRSQDPAGIGGTPPYMAPEHLDAFVLCDGSAVDRRSDVYSLAVVLFELLTGRAPFERIERGPNQAEHMKALAAQRRCVPPSVRALRPEVPNVLDRMLRRCLEPDPADRCQDADELADALEGCVELRRMERKLPGTFPFPRAVLSRPFLWVGILIVVPQLVGSFVNITYNSLQVIGELTPHQHTTFHRVVAVYNIVVYPLCIWLMLRVVRPVYAASQSLAAPETLEDLAEVDRARQTLLTWPTWVTVVSCIGWLPGALLLPLGIHLFSDPVSLHIYLHFFVSVTLSGLIAVTYTYFGVLCVTMRALYPVLWADPREARKRVAAELGPSGSYVWVFQVMAGTIPLCGAILLVAGFHEPAGFSAYRVLIVSLILLGMAGLLLAVFAGELMTKTRAALLAK